MINMALYLQFSSITPLEWSDTIAPLKEGGSSGNGKEDSDQYAVMLSFPHFLYTN